MAEAVSLVALGIRVIGAIVNLVRYGNVIGKYNYLKGYYYVCSQQEKLFIYSPEGIPQFLKIDIGWLNPKTLRVVSKDYDRKNYKRWKTWFNEIQMSGHAGKGSYIYDIGNETGLHEIVTQGKDKIVVRVIDTGKANWKDHSDNEPSTQTWIRVQKDDPLLKKLKTIV